MPVDIHIHKQSIRKHFRKMCFFSARTFFLFALQRVRLFKNKNLFLEPSQFSNLEKESNIHKL